MHTSLTLPPLRVRPVKHALGRIYMSLAPAATVEIDEVSQISISARRSAELYKLANGQSVVLTARKNVSRPAEADGVLLQGTDGDLEWVSHRQTDDVQQQFDAGEWTEVKEAVVSSWIDSFRFRTEERDPNGVITRAGLRPPQIGALFAIGSHWSIGSQPASIVMPTGTGKTETMLATLAMFIRGTLLVVVPSTALRDQTVRKFLALGLLHDLGCLPTDARTPIVGVIKKRPTSDSDLDIFEKCNVVVATMASLSRGDASDFGRQIAERVDTLIVDEAHHIPANTWSTFREQFLDRRVLQFTATPFRRDTKLVDGKVVYTYPLRSAQEDGYFTKINFVPVYEIDPQSGDEAIAQAAVNQLRSDDEAKLNHLIMARCAEIEGAKRVHEIYQRIAPDLNPILVHSRSGDPDANIAKLRSGESRAVVCVDMLGEGFDLPELKVAAIHDTHKSLAVLLQFAGRFTRTAGSRVGDATAIANIAEQEVSLALERLYSEDADWNYLLSEYSSEAIREHQELVEFLNDSERLDEPVAEDAIEISHHLLHPKFSTVTFDAESFHPKRFHEAFGPGIRVHRVWHHKDSNTLYFVTVCEPPVVWTRSAELKDRQWDLYVLHYDAARKLLYVHSSDKSTTHEKLAQAVGGGDARGISGDVVFRTLGGINRLTFQNIGVRKYGRRNLRYALYTGADVREALSLTESGSSIKNNLQGSGWEGGEPVNIGCSFKGRVWCKEQGTVPKFLEWCTGVGRKLQDESIDTGTIIDNVLIPEEVDSLPSGTVLSIEWPVELMRQSEERVLLSWADQEVPLSMFDIASIGTDAATGKLQFRVTSGDTSIDLSLNVGGDRGFVVSLESGPSVTLRAGRLEKPLADFLSDYPPLIRYVDLSELEGNLLVRPKDVPDLEYPKERLEVWDWTETNIHEESIWKSGVKREHSIQGRVADFYREGGFDVIFDDDESGEAADLVCLKEEDDHIRLALVHCKFTTGTAGGERVDDVVAVSSQAVRSARWKWRFRDLCRHVIGREKRLAKDYRPTRFLKGDVRELNQIVRSSRFKDVRAEIVIVQPGLSRSKCTADQSAVLAAAAAFLSDTVAVNLDVICSE